MVGRIGSVTLFMVVERFQSIVNVYCIVFHRWGVDERY